ncbi:ABC transporter ATP-binding protein [Cryobacterium sp. AP23]
MPVAEASASTLPIASSAQVRAAVRELVGRHRGRSAAVAVLFLTASALGLVLPACLGRLVDAVSSGAGLPTLVGWVAGVAAGGIGAAGMALWGTRVLTALVQDALASLREDVFASAMRLPVSTVDDGESADLLSRVTGDVDAVAEAGGNVVPTLLSATFAVAVSLVALTALDPRLALAGIASVPFYLLGTRAFLRRSRVVFREVRVREAARSQAVIDAVEGAETLTALNEQGLALERVRRRAEDSIQMQIEGVRLRNRLFRWINGGEAVGLAAILATGFVLHAGATISVGTVTTAALVFHRLFGPIGQVIFGLDDIQRAMVGLARLVGVTTLARTAPEALSAAGLPVSDVSDLGRTGIDLRGVSFHYPTTGRGVRGVTLRVLPGTTAALIGTSGSGKSTLARVIAGHHPPTSGSLSIGPAAEPPYYISQELHQFRGTIADNMRLAAPEATPDQIVAALRAVGADWAVPSVTGVPPSPPDRGHSGGTEPALDAGRIQQLAVARAFLADPAVVILDEASADVGLRYRRVVEAAIVRLRRNRTTVLIAHRLEHAATADQIVVFADGEATQHGTHDDLVTTEGPYRSFWLAQTAAADTFTHLDTRTQQTETP